jgi:AAA domain (Cdc48 subfamily)
MIAWFVISMVGRLHWFLSLLVTILAISNVAIVWMLSEHRSKLAVVSRWKILRRYIGVVCYFTGEQLPTETKSNGRSGELLLRSKQDFEIATHRAKQIVRGHDALLDRILAKIFENQTLRAARRHTGIDMPLASFLLVGREGVGKRYLLRVLSKLLYGTSAVEVFDCAQLTSDVLIGTKDRQGELLEIIGRSPHTLILFEKIEKASAEVATLLVQLLTTGKLRQPGSATGVSFQEATIGFTTTGVSDSLELLADEPLGETAWQQQAIELIRDETQIDHSLLHAVTDVCFCTSPTELVKAEVVALQMQKECGAHNIQLSNVDPEILATQVLQIDDAVGFQLVPQQVKKLLRKPLVAAAPTRLRSLSLRVRTAHMSHTVRNDRS